MRYGDGGSTTTVYGDDNSFNDDEGTNGDDGTDGDEREPGRDGDEINYETTREMTKRIASKML